MVQKKWGNGPKEQVAVGTRALRVRKREKFRQKDLF